MAKAKRCVVCQKRGALGTLPTLNDERGMDSDQVRGVPRACYVFGGRTSYLALYGKLGISLNCEEGGAFETSKVAWFLYCIRTCAGKMNCAREDRTLT